MKNYKKYRNISVFLYSGQQMAEYEMRVPQGTAMK
jgi:hypothetical protein